jgi:phosphate transport system permease protein
MNYKKLEETIFLVMMRIATGIIILALLLILFSIVYKGLPALSFDMITKIPEGGFYFGKGGGILNAIIGSLYIGL